MNKEKLNLKKQYWQDNNYLDARILGRNIIFPLPKDGKIDVIVDIDLVFGEKVENYEFTYQYIIKRKKSLFSLIAHK